MFKFFHQLILGACCGLLLISLQSFASTNTLEQQRLNALRMMGDQLLLYSGDSTSRVLPIEKEGDRYKIQFERNFQFLPEGLVASIDSVVRQTKITEHYLVEVENCTPQEIVYSYEINQLVKSPMIPCLKRNQEKDCYIVYFSFLDVPSPVVKEIKQSAESEAPINAWWYVALLIPIAFFLRYQMRKKESETESKLIPIGKFQFDQLNAELLLAGQKQELSAKEAELLLLLHQFANKTLKREVILQKVWEDEGDYVGRTLDVFISKLRKRLESDSRIKIVNIRGIGYKMVLNG